MQQTVLAIVSCCQICLIQVNKCSARSGDVLTSLQLLGLMCRHSSGNSYSSTLREDWVKDKLLIQNTGSNEGQVWLDQKSLPSAVSISNLWHQLRTVVQFLVTVDMPVMISLLWLYWELWPGGKCGCEILFVCSKGKACVRGNSQLLFFLTLSNAPGSTKTSKFEEGVGILKL